MHIDEFFRLFEQELTQNSKLSAYHRFTNSKDKYLFRKSYIYQRYKFLCSSMPKDKQYVWDVGCGYGTTAFLLASMGHTVKGTTLEYYFKEIENRINYWKQYFDVSGLSFEYGNLFDNPPQKESFDIILTIDTLHHLEPFGDAVKIFYETLKPAGKIIVCEENGKNIIQNLKNFKQRGRKRIITIYDEQLQKEILFGNENIRSLNKWKKEFSVAPFQIDENSIEYIRFFPPFYFHNNNADLIISKEQKLWRKNRLLRDFMFFGINFLIEKK